MRLQRSITKFSSERSSLVLSCSIEIDSLSHDRIPKWSIGIIAARGFVGAAARAALWLRESFHEERRSKEDRSDISRSKRCLSHEKVSSVLCFFLSRPSRLFFRFLFLLFYMYVRVSDRFRDDDSAFALDVVIERSNVSLEFSRVPTREAKTRRLFDWNCSTGLPRRW